MTKTTQPTKAELDQAAAVAALDSCMTALDVLTGVAVDTETLNETKGEAQNNVLIAFQDAEHSNVGAHNFKKMLCNHYGYSFKHYDQQSDKMITVDGAEAPNVFKVNMSVATRAYTKAGSLKGFATWSEMRDSLKEIDPLTDHKAFAKSIFSSLKKLNHVDHSDSVYHELELLSQRMERLVEQAGK